MLDVPSKTNVFSPQTHTCLRNGKRRNETKRKKPLLANKTCSGSHAKSATPSLQHATQYATHCNRNPVPTAHTANDATIFHRTTTHNRREKEHQETSQLFPTSCLSTVRYSLSLGNLRVVHIVNKLCRPIRDRNNCTHVLRHLAPLQL